MRGTGRVWLASLVATFFIAGCGAGNPDDGGQATILIPPTCLDTDAGARDADRASQANDDAVAAINALDFDTGIAKLREAASAWQVAAADASADPVVVMAATETARELDLSAGALSQGEVDSATDHAVAAFSSSSRVVEALQNSTVPFASHRAPGSHRSNDAVFERLLRGRELLQLQPTS